MCPPTHDGTRPPSQAGETRYSTTEVEYLGMIIKPGQLAMDPVKLDGITSWPTPEKVKDVRSFLGFANFYHHFIPDYSNVARPLIDLTKKNLPLNWSPACQTSFDTLKSLFLSKPVLHLLDPTTPFAITTNTSKYAFGGILLQTLTVTGIPAPIFPNHSPRWNKTMTSMTGNSSPSSMP